MGENDQDLEFTVNEWENKPENNLLAKGRYKFKVLDVEMKVSQTGNNMAVVKLLVEKKRITDWLIMSDGEGKKHQMSWKWHNFLFAIGIRNTNQKFTVTKSQIVNGTGLADVRVNKEETDNQVDNYTPEDKPTAGMDGVPPENAPEAKKDEPKKTDQPKKDDPKPAKKKEADVEDL